MKRTFWQTERWGRVPIVDAKKRRQLAIVQQDVDCATAAVPAIAHALRRAPGTRDVKITPDRVYAMGTDLIYLRYERAPGTITGPCTVWLTPVRARASQAKPKAPAMPEAPPVDDVELPPDPPQAEQIADSAKSSAPPPAPRPVPAQTAMALEPNGRSYQEVAGELLRDHLQELFAPEVGFLGMMFNRERAPSTGQLRRLRDLCLRCGVALWRGARPQLQVVHSA